MPLVPEDLTKILSKTDLDAIMSQYNRLVMGQLLSVVLTTQYAGITPYLTGIGSAIYPELQTDAKVSPLPAANRERCLVALLACRARRLELAIHIYMALANGVEPVELAHILVATGAYTGVDTVSNSFGVMQLTLDVLKGLVGKTADPKSVLGALAAAFPG